LRPSTFVMSDTPVEVQFTSAGCLNYPCRTPAASQWATVLEGIDKTVRGVSSSTLPPIPRTGDIIRIELVDTGRAALNKAGEPVRLAV
jgi:hypothetical protein